MKKIFHGLCILITLSGCTLYRSVGRREFESAAISQVSATSFQPNGCETLSTSSLTLEALKKNYRLEFLDPRFEIYSLELKPEIEILIIEKNQTTFELCDYTFSNFNSWQKVKNNFFDYYSYQRKIELGDNIW